MRATMQPRDTEPYSPTTVRSMSTSRHPCSGLPGGVRDSRKQIDVGAGPSVYEQSAGQVGYDSFRCALKGVGRAGVFQAQLGQQATHGVNRARNTQETESSGVAGVETAGHVFCGNTHVWSMRVIMINYNTI